MGVTCPKPISLPSLLEKNELDNTIQDFLGEKCCSLAFFDFLKCYMLYNNLNIKLLFWGYVWFSKSIEKYIYIYIYFVKIKNKKFSVEC